MHDLTHKTSSFFWIFLGIVTLIMTVWLFIDGPLSKPKSDEILLWYSLLILFINGGLCFILFGVMLYKQILQPYYLADKQETKKHHLFGIIVLFPSLLSLSITIYVLSKSVFWKVIWTVFLLYVLYTLVSNVKYIKLFFGKKGTANS